MSHRPHDIYRQVERFPESDSPLVGTVTGQIGLASSRWADVFLDFRIMYSESEGNDDV